MTEPWREFLDRTSEMLCAVGPDGRITYVNAAWRKALGYTLEEAAERRVLDFVAPEDQQRYIGVAKQLITGQPVSGFEAVLISKDGRRIACRGWATPQVENGVTVGTLAGYHDVSAERESQAVRGWLAAALETSRDFVAVCDPTGRIRYLNRAGRHLVGLAEDVDVTTRNMHELRPEGEVDRMRQTVVPHARANGMWEGESALLDALGQTVPVRQTLTVHAAVESDDSDFLITVMARDLRAQRRSERAVATGLAALAESEARFRVAMDASLDAFYVMHLIRDAAGQVLDFEIVEANERAATANRLQRSDIVGHRLLELVPMARESGLFERYLGVVESGTGWEGEYRTRHPRTTMSIVWLQVVPLRDGDGSPVGIAVTSRDITERQRLQTELTAEREFLGAMLDSLSEGVAAADASGVATVCNRALRELFAIDAMPSTPEGRAELHSRMRRSDDPALPLAVGDTPLARAARGETVWRMPLVFVPPGTPPGVVPEHGVRHIVAGGRPITDATGEQLGAVIAYHDVTHEQAAMAAQEASEERFRRLSDASTDGVIVSRAGIIIEVNAACGRMFVADEGELLGVNMEALVTPEYRDQVRPIVADNREITYPLTMLRLDGSTFEGEVTGRPIVYRGASARISVIRDITAWARVNRLKSEFVSTVSHELRTPLTSIHGSLKLLESGMAGAVPPQAAHLLAIARANSERLIRLINDMLDLDKIEAGKLELRRSALMPAEVVRATLDGIATMAVQARIRLEDVVTAHRTFSGDRDRVVQVLTNLVSNAIKFAPADSVVSVGASEVGTAVRFEVTNSGAGIAAADLTRLFERFQQLDGSDARRHGGTGLGLSIAKAIVEQHGGRIGVDSTPGETTTFWVELPRTRASRPATVLSGG